MDSPTSNIDLSVVVPLFNEEACCEQAVKEMEDVFSRAKLSYELILINNGSVDSTGQILEKLARTNKGFKVLTLAKNAGYGGAIIYGLKEAAGGLIGFSCGDGEVDPADIVAMYQLLRTGVVDFCKGKRINRQDGPWRRFLSFGYHFVVGLFFKIHITDINGYPVLMTRKTYEKLHLTKSNWIFNVEMLLQCRQNELKLIEMDVLHRRRLGGRSHVSVFTPIAFFWQLVRFSWTKSKSNKN